MGNALAVRQVSWMDQFQKFVAEQQEKIRQAEKVQLPYLCVQDALEGLADMAINTFNVSMGSTSVTLSFTADDRTTREEYWRVYKAVHDALVLRKLIQPGAGTYPGWKTGPSVGAYFYIYDAAKSNGFGVHVYVNMRVPEDGTHNIKVRKEIESFINQYERIYLTFNDDLSEPPYQLGPNPKDIF